MLSAAPGSCVVVGAAVETERVVEVVNVIVDLASEFGDLVVDGAALEVCSVAEVNVVACAALEVCSVAEENEVKLTDFAVACAVLEACWVVDVELPSDCDELDVAKSHMTVQAGLPVCILFGTDVQTLRVDPCMIGKPLESSVLLVTNPAKLSKARLLVAKALLCKEI